MDHSRQSVLSAHCLGDTHKKQKERTAQTGQIQGSLFTTLPVPNEARLDNLILISDWVRACAVSKLSLNAASSPLMRKFLSKHIPSVSFYLQTSNSSCWLNFWTPKLLWSSTYDPNSTLYSVLAKFLIPNFLGTDCFVGSIPALLVTSLLSKIFVLKRSQLKISGMDPGQTCLFCQKSEELMDFWWVLHVLNVSLPITTGSCLLTGRPLIRKQLNNLCFCIVIVIWIEFISCIDSFFPPHNPA